ncbi:transposase domain-containing protein, partial [Pseudonocardia oceani]|uniref:transposase domain-containing protein n=1 Tax=Pseudonocardia oceani TaxID=2792013 RepID=UPI0027E2A2DE
MTVAAGVFAPGHLGELTRYLPFELVDDVLVQTRTVQRRLRSLPSRTGVYFVLALGLFPDIGYARVWAKLCAGLTGIRDPNSGGVVPVVPVVSEKALRELRRRLGPAPLKALFDIVAGPLAQPRTPGVSPRADRATPATAGDPPRPGHRDPAQRTPPRLARPRTRRHVADHPAQPA